MIWTYSQVFPMFEQGLAFANRDCSDEFRDCGANAKPLRDGD
jgi:hypothetical protein